MPAAFQLKTFPEILTKMFVAAEAILGDEIDLNVGSILRTTLEAAALQDADQYIQIAKILDLFSLDSAKGDDLDKRALDYGAAVFAPLRRRAANTSIVDLVAGDGTVQASGKLAADYAAGTTSFDVTDGSVFVSSGSVVLEQGTPREETIVFTRSVDTFTIISPVTGFVNPHVINGAVQAVSVESLLDGAIGIGAGSATLETGTEAAWPASGTVIFERSTVRREALPFTRAGTTLTLTGTTTFAHGDDTSLILSTFGSDRNVAVGSVAYVPETFASSRILYRTTEAGVLLDGDITSGLIASESEEAGVQTLAASNTIAAWQSAPFTGASVYNPLASTRGSNREEDDDYAQRIRDFVQSLSRATALAISTLIGGEVDPFTSKTIAFAQVVEPVAPGTSILYVTDGTTTFAIDYQVYSGRDVIISAADAGDQRGVLNSYGPFKEQATPVANRTPRLFRSDDRGDATLVGANFLEDSTQSWTVNQYAGSYVKADDDQFYLVASNTAIRLTLTAGGATPSLGAYSLYDFTADPLIPGTDYVFNKTNGHLELATPLLQYDGVVAADDNALASVGAYTFSRGVAAHAQRLVNGDPTDLDTYPGVRATGTQVLVAAPTVVAPTFTIQVITETGLTDDDLESTVSSVVQAYVNSLGIGANVIRSEIIRLVKGLAGVKDIVVISPSANVSVADGQLARISGSNVIVV